MLTTRIQRFPRLISVLVVLLMTLLLCLALLRFSGTMHLGSSIIIDPNGVTSGGTMNPDGLAGSPGVDPNGLACGAQSDPNGHPCQSHANGLLAAGLSIDGNGAS